MKVIHPHDNSGNSEHKKPLELLKDGQLLSLSHDSPTGLILQKPYYAEYVGPGAAIGGMFDLQCVTIHLLGNVKLTVPETLDERQNAFQKRMEDIEKMQLICEIDLPIDRAIAILDTLSKQFPQEEIQMIANDVLAKLVGVLPSTIVTAWQQVAHNAPSRNASISPSQAEPTFAAQGVAA